MSDSVAIVGGGIGGLTAALALMRRGIAVDVYEQAPELKELGAGVQISSNGTRVLRVFAPLGVLLPPGLGLKIDDKDVGHAPFLRCHSFACYAQVVVEDSLVEQLKTGKTAIFIIFQTEEAGIGIPISLKGFGDALGELK